MRLWPFRKAERRDDLGERIAGLALEQAAVQSVDINRLSVAEAAAGIVGRAFAVASVSGTDYLSVDQLELAGRSLMLRGEYVALIAAAGHLVPVSYVDVLGRSADPMEWGYRCMYQTPGGGSETMLATAESVLHVRVGSTRSAPWRGRSPLAGAMSDVELALAAARSVNDELGMRPRGFLSHDREMGPATDLKVYEEIADRIRDAQPGRPVVFSQMLRAFWLHPQPAETVDEARRTSIEQIAAAAGIPPVLIGAQGDGTRAREAMRMLGRTLIEPWGAKLAAEASAKLGVPVGLDFSALRFSDEDGASRAVARRAQAAKTLVDMGVDRAEALRLSGVREAG